MNLKMQATTVPGLYVARHESALHLVMSDIEHIGEEERPVLEWLGQLHKHGRYATLKDKSWTIDLQVDSDYTFTADEFLVNMIEED